MLAALVACTATGAAALELSDTALRVVEQTNAFRKAHRFEPVSADAELEAAAREFARYMARTGKYGHGADGRRPQERAAAQGYDYCIVSENIAYQYRSRGYESAAALADGFVKGWQRSPEHRENMTDPAVTQTGVGVSQDEAGRYFAVQMFGRPKSAAIRFEVRNRSAETFEYRAGDRRFSLAPRASRMHTVCRPLELSIARPGGPPFKARPADGARYTIGADGAVHRVER